MKFASLGSGSKGNGTLVSLNGTLVLIDCGFTLKETVKRLAGLGVEPSSIDAVLVTHEHSDHIAGVGPFARKFNTPVYMTEGTWRARDIGKIPVLNLIHHYQAFTIKGVEIDPVAVPHDSAEPAQFVVRGGGYKLGVLTDLGSSTPHVEANFLRCDALVLEANHDPAMLASGPYPPSLKERVASSWGHLSNQQAAMLLERIMCSKLKQLVIAHISEQNNSLELTRAQFESINLPESVVYATQNHGFDWISLGNT